MKLKSNIYANCSLANKLEYKFFDQMNKYLYRIKIYKFLFPKFFYFIYLMIRICNQQYLFCLNKILYLQKPIIFTTVAIE